MKGRIIAIVVTVVLAAGIVLALVFGGGPGADKTAVRAYYNTISPLAFEGGRVLQEGIKPAINDLEAAKITPRKFRADASEWERSFLDTRSKFAHAPRIGRLNKTAALYDVSLKEYLDFIACLANAAGKPTNSRVASIRNCFPLGDKANADYDKAKAELKRVMHEVEMPIPANFGLATRRVLARSGRNIA